jgi:hypothetical protein
MIQELCIVNDGKGSSHGLIEGIIPEFYGETEENCGSLQSR